MNAYAEPIATTLSIRPAQAQAVLDLLAAGNTVPFIARYRKEATGNLDEEVIRQIESQHNRLQLLDERRQTILKTIAGQGKLTAELEAAIRAADTFTALEDLYAPYKPKRRTRARLARERGLEGLAEHILRQTHTPRQPEEIAAESYLSEAVPTPQAALQGARDIVAEVISEKAEVRQAVREKALRFGRLRASKIAAAADPRRVYETYYDFEHPVRRLRPHQILALNRGEREGVLRLRLLLEERDWRTPMLEHFPPDLLSPFSDHLMQAMQETAERLLLPAIERDVRRSLTESAERHAIQVFARNLRALLSQPPLSGHVVLGLDPGFRTGCKIAVVDATGKVLAVDTIYPHPPQNRRAAALRKLATLVDAHGVTLIAIGNGTASRETEQLVAELTRARQGLHYLIVNEAGASVYSASRLARAELPELDVSLRGAVSIARRAQDPLAELVKIDPQSIGVGMYQHDVNQTELARALDAVVESVVNAVGVDVNTASPALLAHVSGIGPRLAEKIVAWRDAHGPFPNRAALRQVPGLGPKAFQQAAGFLRVNGGDNPLDATAIHPESYPIAAALLARAAVSAADPAPRRAEALSRLLEQTSSQALAEELGCGPLTLSDIITQLSRPGRDPRSDAPPPILRSDVLRLEDLQPGMVLKGVVRNVVDFGAFIDIGVKQDGLLHRSRLPQNVRLEVGQVIAVEVLSLEPERGRIGLGWAQN